MKFLILGATGATGSLLTDAALNAGHEVIALVRNPRKMPERPGLHVIAGDARDARALTDATGKADALVSALGVGRTRSPDNLILDTTRAVISAAEQTGLRRVVFQSAFGVGASYPKSSNLMRLGYHLAPAVFRDKAAGEQLLTATGLDWTLAYPGMLTNGPRTGDYRTGTDLRLSFTARVSRADVAEFMLAELRDNTHLRRAVAITS